MIEPRVTDKGFAIDVKNYGLTISHGELSRLFEEGYRSPAAQRMAQGQGFGLKIVREIMDLHNGSVDVTHLEGKTTVTLFFPRELQFKAHMESE